MKLFWRCKHRSINLIFLMKIPVKNGEVALDLPPCGANIILFTEKPFGRLTLSTGNARAGKRISVKAGLEAGTGLIPVALELFLPDGTKSSLSRYDVLKNGFSAWDVTIPLNAPAGKWRVKVKELATGQENMCSFLVAK